MKKYIAILLCALLLSGCGKKENAAQEGADAAMTESEPAPARQEVELSGIWMEMEHEIYDPSLDHYIYILYNDSEETVSFGDGYHLEQKTDDGWVELTPKENGITSDVAYVLNPGSSVAMSCGFSGYQEQPEAGEYRLVQTVEIDEPGMHLSSSPQRFQTVYAEFQLGDSPYTADAPYGFSPLESLPEHYGMTQGKQDGAVCFNDKKTENKPAVIDFLQKVSMDIPCQLRTVQEYNEGASMVIDSIYERGRFCWRVLNDGIVDECYFSYVVTDGSSVCLSNGADWKTAENYMGRELVYLVPEGTDGLDEAVTLVKEMTQRRIGLADQKTLRYCVWSPSGTYSAGWTEDKTELMAGAPGRGASFPVTDKQGKPAEITNLIWESEDTLLVYTQDGAHVFSPLDWKLY